MRAGPGAELIVRRTGESGIDHGIDKYQSGASAPCRVDGQDGARTVATHRYSG